MEELNIKKEDDIASLTSRDVKDGDIIVVNGGGMYIVTDNDGLADGSGLREFSGGSSEWADIINKPTAIKEYASNAISTEDVTTIATPGKLLKVNSDSKIPASITGDADTVDGMHAADFATAIHGHTEADISGNISWSKLSGVPNSVDGYGITDAVKVEEVVTVAEPNKLLKLDSNSKLPASITGDAATVGGKSADEFAPNVHGHNIADITGLNDELANIKNGSAITNIDAGIVTGVLKLENLPHGALERCVVVATEEARLALTSSQVQTGDTVKVTSTSKMYFVKDDTQLSSEAGYEPYTASAATSVPWSGVTNTPTTAAGYGITDVYNKDEANSTFLANADIVTTPEANKVLRLDINGNLPASITGEAGSVAWNNITNKPASTADAIDEAVAASAHSNRATLDAIGQADATHMKYGDNTVANMSDITSMFVVSQTQPENQPIGGLWFEVIPE